MIAKNILGNSWISKTLLSLTLFLHASQPLEAVYILRKNITTNGGLSYTGNTLGLSKMTGSNNPGTNDSIGGFITIDMASQLNTYPPGTTGQWLPSFPQYVPNSSAAVLDLPPDSNVLYADLIWSGSYGFDPAISGDILNVPVTLITPQGLTFSISPDPTCSQQVLTPGQTGGEYVRCQEVTSIIQAGGAGTYSVGGVAGTIVPTDETHNCAGWTLAVVYQNPNMITSNLSVFTGCELATAIGNQPSTVTGFCTPSSGPLKGRLFVSAIEGDSNKTGDMMLFGNSLPLTASNALTGSNNPTNNFFCSQLNTLLPLSINPLTGKLEATTSGLLDTRGSFGTTNQSPGSDISGARQGYDITSIDVSSTLVHDQTTAYALGTTTGDDYVINAIGIQIGISAPVITGVKTVNGTDSILGAIGDVVTFNMTFTNVGVSDAFDLIFTDPLQDGLEFVPGTFSLNGIPYPNPNLNTGVILGDLAVGASVSVQFQALVTRPPASSLIIANQSNILYEFVPCNSADPILLSSSTNVVTIILDSDQIPDPSDFIGTARTCRFLNRTSYEVRASFLPSPSPFVAFYQIFSNGRAVGTVPASGPYVFESCFRSKQEVNSLGLTAVYPDGFGGNFVNLVVTYE